MSPTIAKGLEDPQFPLTTLKPEQFRGSRHITIDVVISPSSEGSIEG
jgi:hypothetical protein